MVKQSTCSHEDILRKTPHPSRPDPMKQILRGVVAEAENHSSKSDLLSCYRQAIKTLQQGLVALFVQLGDDLPRAHPPARPFMRQLIDGTAKWPQPHPLPFRRTRLPGVTMVLKWPAAVGMAVVGLVQAALLMFLVTVPFLVHQF
jgi:hypothetical protein